MDPTVFKGIPSEYAEAFKAGASVRIGTLEDFRDAEKHQTGIGDFLDAAISVTGSIYNARIDGNSRVARNLRGGITIPEGISVENTTIAENYIYRPVEDRYVFCATSSLKAELPYDCILELLDPIGAAVSIANALKDAGLGTGRFRIGRVRYERVDRTFFDEPIKVDSFLKGERFRGQMEVRMVFEPTSKQILPVLLPVKWIQGTIIDCAKSAA